MVLGRTWNGADSSGKERAERPVWLGKLRLCKVRYGLVRHDKACLGTLRHGSVRD